MSDLKLGKLPARKDSVSFKLAQYLNLSALPTPPSKAGHQSLVTDWQGMLGNDQYGCCVWAGAAHETILWNKEAGHIVGFSTAGVLSDYSAVTGFNPNDPNTDQGTDMQVAASYRRKTGVKDAHGERHKVAAYLAIKTGDSTELKQAIYLFSNVGIGIQFPRSAMSQFNAGKPWTVVSGSPIDGGHYVPAVGYDSKYVYVVTWGRVQKMSWGFFKKYCDEAIVYLSDEMLILGRSIEGFNPTQLQADLNNLSTQTVANNSASDKLNSRRMNMNLSTQALVEVVKSTARAVYFGLLGIVVLVLTAIATNGDVAAAQVHLSVLSFNFALPAGTLVVAGAAGLAKLVDRYVRTSENNNLNGIAPNFLQR